MVYIILYYYSGEKPVKRSAEKGRNEGQGDEKTALVVPRSFNIQCPCKVNKKTFDIRPGRETRDAPVVKWI